MVIPLARARTQSRGLLEAPNRLNLNDRPQCGFRQTAFSKLAVGVLQRRFAALLPKATLRLNAIYIPAGLIMTGLLVLVAGTALAADLRQPVPEVHALTDLRIVTSPGQVIESGTIVIRDGIIVAVGADITVPDDARVLAFEREDEEDPITVYPGLIEPYLLIEVKADSEDDDKTTPAGRHELVQPDRRLRARDWPDDKIQGLRQAGFTTVLMAPADGLLRGHGLVANTGQGGLSPNLLKPAFGQFASFDGRASQRGFPNSLMGAVALMRQTFDDARWQAAARQAWDRNPAQPRPEWLEGLDDLAPVFEGRTPLVFESQDLLDTLRILEFIEPGDIDLVMVGHGEEYKRLHALENRPVRHILPLTFPDAPDVRDADDRNVSLEDLRHWHHAPTNPKQLVDADIPLLLTTHDQSQPGALFEQIATAIERGFDADRALAALTTEPAAWLGLSDRIGRIATGMMANLVIVEGELFAEDGPSITEVWVDGRQHVLAALVPPGVDPAGTWALTLGVGGMGEVDASLVLRGPPTNMEGALIVMGSEAPLSDVRVSGERVIATIDASRLGAAGTITIRMDIDGERARGTGSGPFGEFTVRGRRTGGPDEEEVN
jgi:hypothetical protein